MSDLRLNYSKTSFQTILDILSDLDKVQKDGNYSIRGWGKEVLNHGLKQNDFDKKDSNGQKLFKSTIRQFKSYKIDLEDLKFIEVYSTSCQLTIHGFTIPTHTIISTKSRQD